MALLEVEGLEAWYARAQILFGVSFSVDAGEADLVLDVVGVEDGDRVAVGHVHDASFK